jgi:uncharacterized protein (TIGR02265 family)
MPSVGTAGSVQGAVLMSRLAFVQKNAGDDAVARVLGLLTDEDRRLLGGVMLPHDWYPFATNVRLDLAIAEEMKRGDAIFRELGVASAIDNLGSKAQQRFVAAGDPHGLLQHTTSIYSIYYDTGYRRYEKVGEKKAILRTHSSQSFSLEDCLTVVGWHEKAIEMCGGKGARVTETRCRAKGDEVCEYICEWG